MGKSEAQVSGAIGDIAEALRSGAKALKKIGADGPAMADELLAERKACEQADTEQEAAKATLKAKTVAKDARYDRMWVKGSGYLDILIASVDKDSYEAEIYRRIRSRIGRRPAGDAAGTLPVPAPGRVQ